MKQLEDEDRRLKRHVEDISPDKPILLNVMSENVRPVWKARKQIACTVCVMSPAFFLWDVSILGHDWIRANALLPKLDFVRLSGEAESVCHGDEARGRNYLRFSVRRGV